MASLHGRAALDQKNEASSGGFSAGLSSLRDRAQTFTVGITGTLTSVALHVDRQVTAQSTGVAFDIRATVGGVPVEDDTGLVRVDIPFTDLPFDRAFFCVDLTSSGLAVTQGEVLALVLRHPSASINTVASWQGSQNDEYAAGATFYRLNYLGDPWWEQSGQDFFFRTYVDGLGSCPGPGESEMAITARDDMPGPVTIHVNAKDGTGRVIHTTVAIWDRNDNGFRQELVAIPSPASSLQLVFVGDSFTGPGADTDRDAWIDHFSIDGTFTEGEAFDRTGGPHPQLAGCTVSSIDGRTVAECGDQLDWVEYGPDPCPGDPDGDGDGICAAVDNCPDDLNPDQLDADGDGTGDACESCLATPETDTDGDGLCDELDNCPSTANPDQHDIDSDGFGDACDACAFIDDLDRDAVCDDEDNCRYGVNPLQGAAVFGQEISATGYCQFEASIPCRTGLSCPDSSYCRLIRLEWPTAVDFEYVIGDFASSSDIGMYAPFFDSTGTGDFVVHGGTPPAGTGSWYLVRPDCPGLGSWQTSLGAEPGRDASLP